MVIWIQSKCFPWCSGTNKGEITWSSEEEIQSFGSRNHELETFFSWSRNRAWGPVTFNISFTCWWDSQRSQVSGHGTAPVLLWRHHWNGSESKLSWPSQSDLHSVRGMMILLSCGPLPDEGDEEECGEGWTAAADGLSPHGSQAFIGELLRLSGAWILTRLQTLHIIWLAEQYQCAI